MPLRPGPWKPPPPRQSLVSAVTVGPAQAIFTGHAAQRSVDGTYTGTWASLLNPPVLTGTWGPLDSINISHTYDPALSGGLDSWELDQWTVDLYPQLLQPFPATWTPPLPWPAHAVAWEYDMSTNMTGLSALLSWDLKCTATVNVADAFASYVNPAILSDLIVNPVDPSVLTLVSGGVPLTQNVTQAQLNTWPVIGRGNVPVGGGITITTDEISVAPWVASADIPGGDTGVVRLAIDWDNMRTGLEPAATSGRRMTFLSAGLTSTWQPPRWRFLYDQYPPLRQFPRDDALGGAPRQGQKSRSVQATERQSWSGNYR